MSTTKQKIILKSLELFNEQGISNVSLRTISDQLEISVGNLQYHFKKREDIVEALYFQLVEKMNLIFQEPLEGDLLNHFLVGSRKIMTTLFDFRFFLLDFVVITRANEKIKKHYRQLSKQREIEILNMVDVLIENEIFRPEMLKNEYSYLFRRLEVISNFWFSSVLIQTDKLSKASVEEYSSLINQSIYAYLTSIGKKQYADFYPLDVV